MIDILIFGKNGQVGSAIIEELQNHYHQYFSFQAYSSLDVDFSNLQALEIFLEKIKIKPKIIINCVAYTNVDKAEEQKELANLINNQALKIIGNYCQKNQIMLVHYSTDYVFNGSGDKPFKEDDVKNLQPVNHYGLSKLNGEFSVINSGCEYIILRISWIYSSSPLHKNFYNTIKKLASEKSELKVIDDQVGSPTKASFVASNTLKLLKKIYLEDKLTNSYLKQIYHLNNGKFISWYQFACNIIDDLKNQNYDNLLLKKITPIKTVDYQTATKRPLNSRLSNEKLQKIININ